MSVADWNNSTVVAEEATDHIGRLKEQPGKDMVIFGSGSIVKELAKKGLIDDYRIFVCPIILGAGEPLFGNNRLALELVDTRGFVSGIVLLHYRRSG